MPLALLALLAQAAAAPDPTTVRAALSLLPLFGLAVQAAPALVCALMLYRARGAVLDTLERPDAGPRVQAVVLGALGSPSGRPQLRAVIDAEYAPVIAANAEARDLARAAHTEATAVRTELARALDAHTDATERLARVCERLDDRDRERAEAHAELVGRFGEVRTLLSALAGRPAGG